MYERILIPLDGSKMGEVALRYVEKLVARLQPREKPKVILLQIIFPPVHHIPVEGGVVDIFNGKQDLQHAKEWAENYLDKAGEGLKKEGAAVECKVLIGEEGVSSADSIIKAEKEVNVDLVAMSTHGRRGLSRWAFGSVTDKVLRSGSVPVLMVRASSEIHES